MITFDSSWFQSQTYPQMKDFFNRNWFHIVWMKGHERPYGFFTIFCPRFKVVPKIVHRWLWRHFKIKTKQQIFQQTWREQVFWIVWSRIWRDQQCAVKTRLPPIGYSLCRWGRKYYVKKKSRQATVWGWWPNKYLDSCQESPGLLGESRPENLENFVQ